MKQKTKRAWTVRGTAILLAAVMMVFAAGCGNKETSGTGFLNEGGQTADNQAGNVQDNSHIEEIAKGRYLETDIGLKDGAQSIVDIKRLSDGSLAIFDAETGLYISKDNGETFEKKETGYSEHLKGVERYVTRAVIGEDGSYFTEYYYNVNPDDEDSLIAHVYADASGNEKELTLSEDLSFYQFLILDDGRLIGGTQHKGVFEIDKDTGSLNMICQPQGSLTYLQGIGDCLYMVSADRVEIYDMKQEKYTEDTVLSDFLAEEDKEIRNAEIYPVLMEQGDTEDSLYIATVRGLFRHVAGGSVMEELIKGSLSSLGAPNMGLTAMTALGTDRFLICFNRTALKSYLYDADSAAVPENTLTVYSLRENEAIGTAINRYRETYPDIYIDYEVGMTDANGVTREDAIRRLNTALLAGEGPDVLVLDGLPIRSYAEKGVLKDMSAALGQKCQSGELYENIAMAFEDNGKICVFPAFFSFSVIEGTEGAGVTDLKSLADCVEKLRQEYPDKNIIGSYQEKEVLMRLYNLCSPAIIRKDGSIDKEMLQEYLVQAKRIWDAEKMAVDLKIASTRKEQEEQMMDLFGNLEIFYEPERMYNTAYRSGRCRLVFGSYVNALNDCAEDASLWKSLGKDSQIHILNGLTQNVFAASTILGINAAGNNQETAEEFVLSLTDKEVQKQTVDLGIPVNKNALREVFGQKNAGEELYSIGSSDENGNYFGYSVYQPTEEEIEKLYQMIGQLQVPADTDGTVKDAVMELGVPALSGEKSIEEAVNEIINRVQIYLEE